MSDDSDFARERREREEAERFELEKMRARALPPVKLRLSTIAPRLLSEYQGVPVFPPVYLPPGGSVDVWWHIEAGELSYRHAGSTLAGARIELLQLFISRGTRLVVLDVCREFGVKPRW